MSASVSSLAQFPADILELILSHSNTGIEVIRLWKCGSKQLNHRLSTGGVTSIHLEDHSPTSRSGFPKMLLSLQKLRFLSIDRSNYMLAGQDELKNLLLQLSPGIESLKLTCKEAETCFFRNPLSTTLHGVELRSSDTQSVVAFENNAFESPLWDIGQKFPKLTCLSVFADSTSILAQHSEYLPSTLSDLSILALDRCEDGKVRKYPSSLTRLHINVHDISFVRLPTNLEYFSGFDATCPEGYASQLPRGLRTFGGLLEWNPSTARAIPPHLTTLSITPVDLSSFEELELNWAGQMPRFLTSLRVHCYTPLGSHQLRALPTTLTSLSTFEMSWATIADETDYPPNLVIFETGSETITASDVAKLPRRLTSLTIHPDSALMTDECFTNLPPNLTSLDILATEMLLSPPIVCEFPYLPRSLTHLRAQMVKFVGPFDASGYPSCVKDRIPPNLTDVKITWDTPRWEDFPGAL